MSEIHNTFCFLLYLEEMKNEAMFLESMTMVIGHDAAKSQTSFDFFLLSVTVSEIWYWEFF